MIDRPAAVVLLALLALTAGCNGLGGDATKTTAETPTHTQTPTPEPIYDPPLSGETVMEPHQNALETAETFRYDQRAVLYDRDRPGDRQFTILTADVSLSENRVFLDQNVSLVGDSQVYGKDGSGYQRLERPDGVQYRTASEEDLNTSFYARPPIDGYLDGLDYVYAGTSTENGTTVHTYRVTNTSQVTGPTSNFRVVPPANMSEVRSTVRISERGIVRSFEYHVVGQSGDLTVVFDIRIEYTGIGSTTVEEPAWLPEARNATG